jgi:hypothetical protein
MLRLALLATLLLALSTPAAASADRDAPASRAQVPEDREHSRYGTFSSAERNLIRAFLRQAPGAAPAANLPPGLQRQAATGKELPPGWQQQLTRGTHLSQEFYGWGRPLPADLLRRLPPPPPGSEILQIESRVLRLDAATRTILDLFSLDGR